MFISVIIPTCNRNETLMQCLNCLEPGFQTIDSLLYEVIVSNDGLDNQSHELIKIKYPWVKWIEGPKKGPAANRNFGASFAKGEWLIFFDDDCLPDANILNKYSEITINYPGENILEGCIKVDREKKRLDEESPVNLTGGFLWSCNFMIKRTIFVEKLKGFDEKFPYAAMEDVDLNFRIIAQGMKPLFVKDAFVIHPWRIRTNMYSHTQQHFSSLLYYLKKHPSETIRLNSITAIRICYADFKQIILNGYKYSYRGIFSQIVHLLLTFYFSILLFLKKINLYK